MISAPESVRASRKRPPRRVEAGVAEISANSQDMGLGWWSKCCWDIEHQLFTARSREAAIDSAERFARDVKKLETIRLLPS